MFKLEFPAENKTLAAAIGRALVEYSTGSATAYSTGSATAARLCETLLSTTFDAPAVDETVELKDAHNAESISHGTFEELPGKSTQSTAEQGVGAAQGATDAKVDNHGVPFDADYCANASDPYYKTGKNAGQWKKKKGVDQDEYDDWYAAARPKSIVGEERTDAEIDTTAAFSGQQHTAQTNTAAPATAGAFMVWISEMTTAGHFTQADVTAAYTVVGIGAPDIFQGENAVQNIASLYGVLSAKVPA